MYTLTVIRFNCGVRNLLRFLTTFGAYTTYPRRHVLYTSYLHCYYFIMSKNSPVELRGFEPRTPCLQSRCSSQLSYSPNSASRLLWAWEDLNLRPHAYQACALTT